MVHFGEKLRANTVRRWAGKYIDYKRLKQVIKRKQQLMEEMGTDLRTSSAMMTQGGMEAGVGARLLELSSLTREQLAAMADAEMSPGFLALCMAEMEKVDSFYSRKCEELASRLHLLEEQVNKHAGELTDSDDGINAAAPARTCPLDGQPDMQNAWGSKQSILTSTGSLPTYMELDSAPPSARPLRASPPVSVIAPAPTSARAAATIIMAAPAPSPPPSITGARPGSAASLATSPSSAMSPSLRATAAVLAPSPLRGGTALGGHAAAGSVASSQLSEDLFGGYGACQAGDAPGAPVPAAATALANAAAGPGAALRATGMSVSPPSFAHQSNGLNSSHLSSLRHRDVGRQSSPISASRQRGPRRLQQRHLSVHSIKRAYLELYRSLALLQNYAILNYTGFVKIAKKHDKLTQGQLSPRVTTALNATEFARTERVQQLIGDLEQGFARNFCDGDVHISRALLLVKQRPPANWTDFRLGLRVGMMLLLLCWVAWDCIVDDDLRDTSSAATAWLRTTLPVFRGLGCLVALYWCWGVSIMVWTSARINYMYILELNPYRTFSYHGVFERASLLSIILLSTFLLFFKGMRGELPESGTYMTAMYPLIAFVMVTVGLLFPLNDDVLRAFKNTMIAPFGDVNFLAAYVGDVLTSLVKVLVDLAFSLCYFTTGHFLQEGTAPVCQSSFWFSQIVVPLLCALPLWWRLNQNLRRYRDTGDRHPFLTNALKYGVAHSVVLFGVFHPDFKTSTSYTDAYRVLWLLSMVASTIYTFSWDVLMDWGLGWRKHRMLRERRMFRKTWIYYAAIVIDFFMRFLWTLTIAPTHIAWLPSGMVLDSLLALAEILRRTMWGAFRLEFAHLSSTENTALASQGGTRKVAFVPLHFETPLAHTMPEARTRGCAVFTEVFLMAGTVLALGAVAFLSRQ